MAYNFNKLLIKDNEIILNNGKCIVQYTDDYLEDDFLILYNGLTNYGKPLNVGSFGSVLRDTNGPIFAPDGLGMPYFDRDNFTGSSNNYVQFVDDEFKYLNAGNAGYTIEFWFTRSGKPKNKWYLYTWSMNNNIDSSHDYIITDVSTGSDINKIETMYGLHEAQANVWHHVAFVKKPNEYKRSFYLDGKFMWKVQQNDNNTSNSFSFRYSEVGQNGGIKIAQFAVRKKAIYDGDFEVPTKLYKQK